MFTKRMVFCLVAAAGALLMAGVANAEFTGPGMDSADFLYKYEMDVMPTTQDLDGVGGVDMGTYGSGISVSGGILTATHTNGNSWIGCEDSAKVWQSSMGNGDYTIEFTNKVIEDTGNVGAFLILAGSNTSSPTMGSFTIGDQDVRWNGSYGGPVHFSGDNTDAFHTYRMALQSGKLYVWRDGVIVTDGVNTSNPDFANMFFGGGSGEISGTTQMEYFRMTPGAYGYAVPEPSSIAIAASMLLGLLAYAWRKRK